MIDKNELIFGTRAVIEAIEAGKDIDKILPISLVTAPFSARVRYAPVSASYLYRRP